MKEQLKIIFVSLLLILNYSFSYSISSRQYTLCEEGDNHDLHCNLAPDAKCQKSCEEAKKAEGSDRRLIKVGISPSRFCRCNDGQQIKKLLRLESDNDLIYSYCVEEGNHAVYCSKLLIKTVKLGVREEKENMETTGYFNQ